MLLAGVLCLSLCACADQPVVSTQPTPEVKPVATPEPVKTLSLAYDPQADMNPITTDSPVNRMLTTLIYEGLFALDESLTPYPVLAERMEKDSSGTVWTVTVKEGVVFSDGTPLEAEHVADSLNSARTSTVYAQRLRDVKSVRVKDGKVVITLSAPNGNFPALLDIPIVLEREEGEPLGTGRYCYVRSGQELFLQVNYNREGKPPYETISLYPAVGTSGRISAFDSGSADITLTDFTSPYSLGYSCDYERWDYTTADLLYVGFRCVDSPCAEAPVRQAVANALDRAAIVAQALIGYGDAVTLPFPEGHADWYEEAAALLEYDPAAAEELLMAAGYVKNEADGLLYREREQLAVTLLVNSDNPFKVAVAEMVAESLADLGAAVTVKALQWQDYLAALEKGEFDLYLAEVRMTGDFDITELITGSLNYGDYDPIMMSDLIAARKAGEGSAREVSCRNLWNIFAIEVPVAPICFMRESMLVRWEAGLKPTPQYYDPFCNLEQW